MRITVQVTNLINVEMDESKFTRAFMKEFRSNFYDFDTIFDHARHLAQLHARGLVGDKSFIEGYGPATEMGIKFHEENIETEVV